MCMSKKQNKLGPLSHTQHRKRKSISSVSIRKTNPRNQELTKCLEGLEEETQGRAGSGGWAPDLLVSRSTKTAASWRSEHLLLVPLLLETGDQKVDRGLQLLLALVGTRLSTA